MEHFLGQTWVLVAAFLIGSTVLYLIYRRRSRADGKANPPGRGAPRPAGAPKAAPATAAPPPQPENAGSRKGLEPGFRGIKWGQPPVDGMRVVHEDGDTRFLARASDDLRIGSANITSVAYSFRLNRLEAVIIDLPISGFELLARHLTGEWGPPRSSADRSKHVWADSGAGPEASQAVLEKKAENRTARLLISSRAGNAERASARPVA
ncbi:MAG TPA: hypothetical protein VE129_04170 [Thermoanaerobaculia bacterium]|nr:hypothetical protein [Thermoanaerobaculia bacterium]